MLLKIRKALLFVILASIITYLLIKLSIKLESNYRKYVVDNHSFAIGKIDYITPGNEAFSMSIKYIYFVGDEEFSRIVEIPRNKRKYYKMLDLNNKEREICFWVAYSDVERSNSLVDIVNPFKCDSNKSFPRYKNLNSFL